MHQGTCNNMRNEFNDKKCSKELNAARKRTGCSARRLNGGKPTPGTSSTSNVKPRLLTTLPPRVLSPFGLIPTWIWIFDLTKTLVRGSCWNSPAVKWTQVLQTVDSRLPPRVQEAWGKLGDCGYKVCAPQSERLQD